MQGAKEAELSGGVSQTLSPSSMQFTTGGLKKLFARRDGLTQFMRNAGMSLAGGFDPINQALTRHAVL